MAIGLAALIPVIGVTGGTLVAAGVEGLAVGWISLAVGEVWIGIVIWWTNKAPKVKRSPVWW